ncbi:MAG: DUF5004 domain-containing protein [Bacteroidales bacterium]
MKTIKIIFLMIVATGFMLSGCKKDYPAVGDISNKSEAIQGTWKADKMVQVDYIAKEKGEDLFQWDATNIYKSNDFVITFDANGSFAISGLAHNFAKISTGTWSLDDPEFPTKVTLTNGAVTDAFTLLSVPKTGFDMFDISYDRYSGGKKIIGYQYHLKKQ